MQTITGSLVDPLTLTKIAGPGAKMSFTEAGAVVVHMTGTTPGGVPAGLRVTTLADIAFADFVGLETASLKYLHNPDTGAAEYVSMIDIAGISAATFYGEPVASVAFASDGANIVPVELVTNAGIAEASFKGLPVFAVQAKGDETNFVHVPLNGNAPTKTNASVLVTSTLVVNARQDRTSIFIQNQGNYDVWINWGADAAVVGSGLYLAAGSWISFSNEACPSNALRAIANGGTSAVYVQETGVEAH